MEPLARLSHLLVLSAILSLIDCRKETKENYTVDESASMVEWKGYLKDVTGNNGTVGVKGSLSLNESSQLKQGEFYLPLASLESLNFPAPELKRQLIRHLQSADFFNMALYVEIHFQTTEISPDTEKQNFRAKSDLTFLGKTLPVVFPVKISGTDTLLIERAATIDRTLWGMTYASDENATDGMYMKSEIDLQLKVKAVKVQSTTETTNQ